MKPQLKRTLGVAVVSIALLPLMVSGSGGNKPDVLIARGDSYARKGEYDKAIADFTDAIRLEPNHAQLYSGSSPK